MDNFFSTQIFKVFRTILICLFFSILFSFSASAAVKINSVVCANTTVSKGQTGIVLNMEVENLDVGSPVTVSLATLTYTLGDYETTLNSPSLPAVIPASGKVVFKFTVSVFPLSPSGNCLVDGAVNTSAGNVSGADLPHNWTIQQPAEIVITTILGASEVTRGSNSNQVIMDISRSGEADVVVNSADLSPVTPTNYSDWRKISPSFPQNFTKVYWWDDRWLFRRQMKITNRSSSILPETYEIKFTFDHANMVSSGKSLASGNDIRIVYFNGSNFVQVERYLDPLASAWNQSDTTIWFRLQAPLAAAPANTDRYALYYGANAVAAATPPDDPSNVFVFFDDFEQGQNGWSQGRFPGYTNAYADRWELGNVAGDGVTDDDDQGPASPRSGNNVWATDLDRRYDNSGHATREMISLRTPDIDLVGKLNPSLTFWDFYDIENGGAYDFGKLRVCQGPVPAQSDPMQANGTQLQLLESTYLNQHGPWTQQTYNLSPSVGKQVYLEFTFGSDWAANSYGWAIDDIMIRQIAVPEPDNPLLGVEEPVPLTPTIKAYYEVDVDVNAISGNDIIDGIASGTEGNTGQEISDNQATLPLQWLIKAQDFNIFKNPFYVVPRNDFNIGETAYGFGKGYTPNVPCRIQWFDPSMNLVQDSTVYPDTSGNIYNSRLLLPTDSIGQWKIKIYNVSGSETFAETTFNLTSPAQLVSEIIVPDEVIVGQEFTITHKISNAGQTKAIGVSSSALTSAGGGSYNLLSGPTPTSLTIPGGGSGEITWQAAAVNPGHVSCRGNAQGTTEGTTNTTVSESVTSNILTILTEAIQFVKVEADDSIVNRGQNGIVERVEIQNTGNADLNLEKIDLLFKQGATDESANYSTIQVAPSVPAVIPGNNFPPWWNTNYQYRQKLRITGDNNSYAAGCSSRITVDTDQYVASGKLQADRDDWRVVYWNDTTSTWTEIDRDYISNEVTWFRLQNPLETYGRNENYYIYYGNPAATNPPANLDNVYIFFEDWETPVRGGGTTRRNANVDINGDGEWRVGTDNTDGIYIYRNQWDGGNFIQRGAQALCFRRLDFPNVNGFAEVFRNLDTQTYPNIILSLWRYYDDNCDWDGGTRMDWSQLSYFDGGANQEVIFYPGNGPDDSTWHYEEYDLSGFNPSAAGRIHFRSNFWWGGASTLDRILFDDIKAMMAAPDAIGIGEEVQKVTSLIATFSVAVGPLTPTGLYTLDASGTFSSVAGTGSYQLPSCPVKDSWTVNPQSVETYIDAGYTTLGTKFALDNRVYVKGAGFTPGATQVRWYDDYPVGTQVFLDNVVVGAGGEFTANRLIPSPNSSGVWKLAISQGGIQVATGSFRMVGKPQIFPRLKIDQTSTTVGVPVDVSLEIQSGIRFYDFNSDTVGNSPPGWNCNIPASLRVRNDSTYTDDPETNYFSMESNAATTLRAFFTIGLKELSELKLDFNYSTVFSGAAQMSVEYSVDGGGVWKNLFTETSQTGAKSWQRKAVNLPDECGDCANLQVRFSFATSGAGWDRAMLDNIVLLGKTENLEDVIFEPLVWQKTAPSTGDMSIMGSPVPALSVLSPGKSLLFSAQYMPITQTNLGQPYFLHGAGAPALVASGSGLLSGQPINASDTESNGLTIYLEALSVVPAVANMGTVAPGNTSAIRTIAVNNTGNVNLEYVKWEFYNLASDPYFIPYGAINVTPDPIGALAGSQNADLTITIPPGTLPGTYRANQFVFEDNDQDGNSMDEPIGQFEMVVTVPEVEKIICATSSIYLGAYIPGETTATTTVFVTNAGNVDLFLTRFVPGDLSSGGNTIASSNFNLKPFVKGFLTKGSSFFQDIALNIPGATPAGSYIGTGLFIDDKDADQAVDAGEANCPLTISVFVGTTESFTLSAGTVTLADTLPGDIGVSGNITVTNTGNIPLANICFIPAALTVSGQTIGPEYISFSPDPVGNIDVGNNANFQVFVVMPPGQPNPGGRYTGLQTVFNDKNGNGILDAGESQQTFNLRIRPGNNRDFVIANEVANLGAGLPLDTVSGNIEVLNKGNLTSDRLKWFMTGNLTSGANVIGAGNISYDPPNGWVLANTVGGSQLATVTVNIPAAQPAGTYVGQCLLFRDSNNNGNPDDGDASDTFIIQIEVGVEGVDVLETSPFDLGQVGPGQPSPTKVFSVQNIGERTLSNLKYEKPDLIQGAITPIPWTAQAYSVPDPLGLISGGVVVGPSVYVNVPPNKEPGIYTGTLRVYEDKDNDGVYDGLAEVSDTLDYRLEVLSQADFNVLPSVIDFGGIEKGQTVSKSFTGTNLGNIDVTKIRYSLSDMVDGGNTIPVLSQTVTLPETPWVIPFTGTTSENGSISLATELTTPTGNYVGQITFWEDSNNNMVKDAGELSTSCVTKVSIGKKDLEVLENELNFGVVSKGDLSSEIKFTVRNRGTVALTNTRVISAALVGPGTIPTTDLQFSSLIVTPPNLNPGVTRQIGLKIQADAALPSGIYSGVQRVYEDLNNNGTYDAGLETTDTFNVTVTITSGGVLSYEVVTNPGLLSATIGRGNSSQLPFKVVSLCSNSMTDVQFQRANLVDGASTIPLANLGFTPAGGFTMGAFAIQDATATVNVPGMTPAGVYTGLQHIVDLDHTVASTDIQLEITVPPVSLTVSPLVLDLGIVGAGTAEKVFSITNPSSTDANLDFLYSDFLGSSFTIPAASATVLIPGLNLVAGASTLATVSITLDSIVPGGDYIATLTTRDFNFPDEASPTMVIKFTMSGVNPNIGDYIFQEITNKTIAGSVASSVPYVGSVYVTATSTIAPGASVVLQVREWKLNDNKTALATHTVVISGAEINRNLGKWQRIKLNYTAINSTELGSFTVELGIKNGNPGDIVLFDGIMFEKAVSISGAPTNLPTPWVKDKGIVSPSFKPSVNEFKPYYTW